MGENPNEAGLRMQVSDFYELWRCNNHDHVRCYSSSHQKFEQLVEEANKHDITCSCWQHDIVKLADRIEPQYPAENEVLKRRIERAVAVADMELGGHPIGNRLRSVLGVKPRMSDAVKAVTDAWVVEGASPRHHRSMKRDLKVLWPSLAHALSQLVDATQTRVNVIPNPVAPPIGAKVQAIPNDKVNFTIHMVVTRNDDGVPPWSATLVGRKRAFKDASQLIWMHWVRAKHGGNT